MSAWATRTDGRHATPAWVVNNRGSTVMDSRYSIIISCLKLLKASSWSTTKKLRAEIKFIKIKRHLLNEDSEASMTGSCGEAVFNALLYQISSIKEAGWERDAHPLLLHSLED